MPLIIHRKGLDACCLIARMPNSAHREGNVSKAHLEENHQQLVVEGCSVSARAFHVCERNIPAVIFKVGCKCKPSRLVKDKSIEDKFLPCHASASWRFRPGCKSTSSQDEQMHSPCVADGPRYHYSPLGLLLVALALPCRSPWVCLRYGLSLITLFNGKLSGQDTNKGKGKACMPRSESPSGEMSGGPREANMEENK